MAELAAQVCEAPLPCATRGASLNGSLCSPFFIPCPAPACPLLQAKGQEALVERLTKNVGTAIGLELRDSTQALNATNTKPVKPGMTFNVTVGEPCCCCCSCCYVWTERYDCGVCG